MLEHGRSQRGGGGPQQFFSSILRLSRKVNNWRLKTEKQNLIGIKLWYNTFFPYVVPRCMDDTVFSRLDYQCSLKISKDFNIFLLQETSSPTANCRSMWRYSLWRIYVSIDRRKRRFCKSGPPSPLIRRNGVTSAAMTQGFAL